MRQQGAIASAATIFIASLVVAFQVAPRPALAQEGLLERIQERASVRTEILKLLNSDDPQLALAALEEAAKGEDPEMRLSAFEVAFASQDQRLRKAALRYFLDGRPEVRLEVVLPDRPDKGQQNLFDVNNGYRFRELKIDPTTDILTFGDGANRFWSGQLVVDGFELSYSDGTDSCVMSMRIADAQKLTGQLSCVIGNGVTLRNTDNISRVIVPVVMRMS